MDRNGDRQMLPMGFESGNLKKGGMRHENV